MDLRPSMDDPMAAFGLPAVVSVEGKEPVTAATAFWLPPTTEETPVGGEYTRRESLDVLVLRKSEVPTAPRGTIVEVAYVLGADVETWRVDGFQHGDADHHRLVMMRVSA